VYVLSIFDSIINRFKACNGCIVKKNCNKYGLDFCNWVSQKSGFSVRFNSDISAFSRTSAILPEVKTTGFIALLPIATTGVVSLW
jgi:hypothetical protein